MKIPLSDGRLIDLARPVIMGILNLTPDSFSDGGKHDLVDHGVEHALLMFRHGADIIDVGGESTRPGSQSVPAEEQIRRVTGVIQRLSQLRASTPSLRSMAISIDTSRPEVAAAAIDAGADLINDIFGGRDAPSPEGFDMLQLAARRSVPIVLMHMQGTPATMQQNPAYTDVVREIREFLIERAQRAMDAGVAREKIILDPGVGFGKTREHNLSILANLSEFASLGFAVLLGSSRKRFMGSLSADREGQVPSPSDLVGATCATTTMGVLSGVRMFRVHDVRANRQAADVAMALQERGWKGV